MTRYLVLLTPYSLEAGHVGEERSPAVYSYHRSQVAAGRVLGSLISGKRARETAMYHRQGEALKYHVFDTATGERFTRNQCKGH
jgi:hypothetical protein